MVLFSAAVRKFPHSTAIGVTGAALLIAGLVIGFAGIGSLMFDDRYLAVVEGGLLVHLGKDETFYTWESLEAIRHEGTWLVVVPRPLALAPLEGGGSPSASASQVESQAGAGSLRFPLSKKRVAEIAARLEEWRRRDAWNLAPPPGP
jgi:hypothetical protein